MDLSWTLNQMATLTLGELILEAEAWLRPIRYRLWGECETESHWPCRVPSEKRERRGAQPLRKAVQRKFFRLMFLSNNREI